MEKNNILENTKKPYLIIVFTILTIITFGIGSKLANSIQKQSISFENNRKSVNEIAFIEITNEPIEFKTTPNGGTTQTLYIVSNEKQNYIVKLTTNTYTQLMKEYQENQSNFKYRIEGKTKSIYESLKESSMKAYNDEKQEKMITSKNYVEYFGESYIDETENSNFDTKLVVYAFTALFFVIDLIVILEYIHTISKLNKAIKQYGREELEEQLNDSKTISYDMAGIYLTEKYIISKSTDFKVIPYENIYWMYILKRKTNGITVGKHIMVCTKNKKVMSVAINYKEGVLEEIMEKIHKKNEAILIGYNKENQAKYKRL